MADLIERTRPADRALADEWTPAARRELVNEVIAGRARRVPLRRRAWPLAVAASAAAGAMLVVPVTFPGWFGANAAADDLGRLAQSARAQTSLGWEDGQFLRVASVDTITEASVTTWRGIYDDYHTADGWTWSDRVINGEVERYIFPPAWGWHRPDYAAAMPAEPHLLDAFLRLRAMGSTSQDEAVFIAIGDMLRAESAPVSVRVAAIGVLGLNPKVTAEHSTDPEGRPALKVTFVDEATRPGMRQVLYLDPTSGVLLAKESTTESSRYLSVVTRREVVEALPASLTGTLGSDKVEKSFSAGKVTTSHTDRGPDPVPVPPQSYPPPPKR
ncbi:MAG: hypothetical protein QM708_01365 [Propioniciclava sp.]|uniref:hypothetical protein n=1 Tax=Propioniciclava sp. TaxID=2038686 RepID=UPI0039E5AEF5